MANEAFCAKSCLAKLGLDTLRAIQ